MAGSSQLESASKGRSRSRSPIAASSSDGGNRCRVCMLDSCSFCQGLQCTCGVCKLVSPCQCRGSVQHIHEHCLVLWLRHSLRTSCELCGAAFPLWLLPKEALTSQHNKRMEKVDRRIERAEAQLFELRIAHSAERRQWEAAQRQHGNRLQLLQLALPGVTQPPDQQPPQQQQEVEQPPQQPPQQQLEEEDADDEHEDEVLDALPGMHG